LCVSSLTDYYDGLYSNMLIFIGTVVTVIVFYGRINVYLYAVCPFHN